MDAHVIVGLGNPGKAYELTRHNFGFLVMDYLAAEHRIKFTKSLKYNSLIGQGVIDSKKVVLLKPQTFMNRSGAAVGKLLRDKEADLGRLLVVCDDFHLGFGSLRIRARGSNGGHNGLASVAQELKTPEFARLRLGIGAPTRNQDVADFVLSLFTVREQKALEGIVSKAAACCQAFLGMGVAEAMNAFNTKNQKGEKKDRI